MWRVKKGVEVLDTQYWLPYLKGHGAITRTRKKKKRISRFANKDEEFSFLNFI